MYSKKWTSGCDKAFCPEHCPTTLVSKRYTLPSSRGRHGRRTSKRYYNIDWYYRACDECKEYNRKNAGMGGDQKKFFLLVYCVLQITTLPLFIYFISKYMSKDD